jgi:hypothetical protein
LATRVPATVRPADTCPPTPADSRTTSARRRLFHVAVRCRKGYWRRNNKCVRHIDPPLLLVQGRSLRPNQRGACSAPACCGRDPRLASTAPPFCNAQVAADVTTVEGRSDTYLRCASQSKMTVSLEVAYAHCDCSDCEIWSCAQLTEYNMLVDANVCVDHEREYVPGRRQLQESVCCVRVRQSVAMANLVTRACLVPLRRAG